MGSYSPPPLPPAAPPAPDLADQAVQAARRMQLARLTAGNGRASTFLGGSLPAGTGLFGGGSPAPAAPTTRKPLLGG